MKLGQIDGLNLPEERGVWLFDDDDFALMAMLQDQVYCAELLWEDATNRDYSGCYRVRDYQYPLFRVEENNAIFACSRSVGKTESLKSRAMTHAFRRMGEEMLITAPELIHLLPLTDAIEERIQATRLTREFLDTRNQSTGFKHRPFQADFIDGTKLIGRIPRLTGVGVKGIHEPDLVVDEGQDYPPKGWIELNETLNREHMDAQGNPDYTFHVYGVHSGDRDSGFYRRADVGGFKLTQVTALQRLNWGEAEKNAAKAAYGGTQSPDYRRNILGEPGSASSAYFITSRLIACMEQDREKDYNVHGYVHQPLRVEEFDELGLPMKDVLDLPANLHNVWVGMDVGLTISPTVITIWDETKYEKKPRLQLVRRITLERFRTKQIREACYAIGYHFGRRLMGFGMDNTGLGFPIFQEMEDDENAPQHLMDVARGYFFNASVPVGVDKTFVTKDASGQMRDQYGSQVKEETDPLTGLTRYVTYMPMIEASTRYLREAVDSNYLLLPFDPDVIRDMQAESKQRVERVAGMKRKPNALHILDSMRAMAMVKRAGAVEAALENERQVPVLDEAMEFDDAMF